MSRPHPLFQQRSGGVLLPLSSLPGGHGVGDLGPGALDILDWLAAAGLSWWQLLPVGPVDTCGSPYSSPSSFAGEPLYLSLERLAEQGLLTRADLRSQAALRGGRVDWQAVREFKGPRLERAWRAFGELPAARRRGFRAWCERQADWLDPWAERDGLEPEFERWLQYEFHRQWQALRGEARERGVRLLGDLPFFVEADSVDVARSPELFRLDRKGHPTVVTGVPPDAFSKSGQLWGHAHYDWKQHRRTGFAWWVSRLEAQLERYDAVRVDHFIGFVRAWEVPARARSARKGRWRPSPGREILAALEAKRGSLALVAEDLGAVTPPVRALRDEFALPGMRVMQWAFSQRGAYDRPHYHPPLSVAYTGTHDNDTALGWWRSLGAEDRRRFLSLTGGDASSAARDFVRLCYASPSNLAVVPVQDLLELGSKARFNTPGTRGGNWTWRLAPRGLTIGLAKKLRILLDACDRLMP